MDIDTDYDFNSQHEQGHSHEDSTISISAAAPHRKISIVRPVPAYRDSHGRCIGTHRHRHRRSVSLPFAKIAASLFPTNRVEATDDNDAHVAVDVDADVETDMDLQDTRTHHHIINDRPRPSSACGPSSSQVSGSGSFRLSGSAFYSGAQSGFKSIDIDHNFNADDVIGLSVNESTSASASASPGNNTDTPRDNNNVSRGVRSTCSNGSFILNAQSQMQIQPEDDERELDFLHRRGINAISCTNSLNGSGAGPGSSSGAVGVGAASGLGANSTRLSLSPFEALAKDRNYNWPGQKGGKISPLPREEYQAWAKRREREMEMVAQQQHSYRHSSTSTFRPVPVSPLEMKDGVNVNVNVNANQCADKHAGAQSPSRHDLMRENHMLKDRIEQLEQMLSIRDTGTNDSGIGNIQSRKNVSSHIQFEARSQEEETAKHDFSPIVQSPAHLNFHSASYSPNQCCGKDRLSATTRNALSYTTPSSQNQYTAFETKSDLNSNLNSKLSSQAIGNNNSVKQEKEHLLELSSSSPNHVEMTCNHAEWSKSTQKASSSSSRLQMFSPKDSLTHSAHSHATSTSNADELSVIFESNSNASASDETTSTTTASASNEDCSIYKSVPVTFIESISACGDDVDDNDIGLDNIMYDASTRTAKFTKRKRPRVDLDASI